MKKKSFIWRLLPWLIVLAALALIIVGLMCWVQYQTDQLPGRATDADRVFGTPAAPAEDSGYSEDSASEDSGEGSGDEESYADEEE